LGWVSAFPVDGVLKDAVLGVDGLDEVSFDGFDFEEVFFGVGGSAAGGSFDSFDFEDDFFGVGGSGGDMVGFEDGVFAAGAGVALGGAAAFCGGATFGRASFDGAPFDSFFLLASAAAAAAFGGACPAAGVFLGGVGCGSGARSIKDSTGALVVGAVNCPSAIWRARSFTLRNILT
jgi:hypothetical protein